MRIAVLAHGLATGGGRVVGTNVVATLPAVAPGHEYLVTAPPAAGYPTDPAAAHVRIVELAARPRARRVALEYRLLPRLLHDFQPDWTLALANVPVANPPGRQALLIHEPTLFYSREERGPDHPRVELRNRAFLQTVRRRLRHVDVVFCQTEVAAARFSAQYGFPDVALLPNAVSADVAAGAGASTADEPGGDRFSLLSLTRYYPHKNLETVVEAYRRYPDELAATRWALTVEATDHPWARRLLASITESGLDSQIVNLGRLPHEQIGGHYAAADAVIVPSRMESFSGTYLESMRFERPILTSDRDFARSVCGAAAMYFDPLDPGEIKDAILALVDQPQLGRELVAAGRHRLEELAADWPSILRNALDRLGIATG